VRPAADLVEVLVAASSSLTTNGVQRSAKLSEAEPEDSDDHRWARHQRDGKAAWCEFETRTPP